MHSAKTLCHSLHSPSPSDTARLVCHSVLVSQGYSLASLSFCSSVPGIQPGFFVILSRCPRDTSQASLSCCPSVPGIQPGFFVILFRSPTDTTRTLCHSVPVIQSGFCVILSRCPRDTFKLLCHAVPVSQSYSLLSLSFSPSLPGIKPGFFVILSRSPKDVCSQDSLSFSPRDTARLVCHSVPISGYRQDPLSLCSSPSEIHQTLFVILF
jgi:hypothetical protein